VIAAQDILAVLVPSTVTSCRTIDQRHEYAVLLAQDAARRP
jgi:hypothetical protein